MSYQRTRRRSRSDRTPISAINMTPFIDVMLVLLIIFMVAMPVLETGEKVDVASDGQGKPSTMARLFTADLKADGSIQVSAGQDRRAADLAGLKGAIDGMGTPEGGKVYLRADDEVSYERYFQLVSAVREAGLVPVIVAKPKTLPNP